MRTSLFVHCWHFSCLHSATKTSQKIFNLPIAALDGVTMLGCYLDVFPYLRSLLWTNVFAEPGSISSTRSSWVNFERGRSSWVVWGIWKRKWTKTQRSRTVFRKYVQRKRDALPCRWWPFGDRAAAGSRLAPTADPWRWWWFEGRAWWGLPESTSVLTFERNTCLKIQNSEATNWSGRRHTTKSKSWI